MGLNLFKIKKWGNMILGCSHYHVNQTEGLCYSVNDVAGYYNNLTEKITRFGRQDNEVPLTTDGDGNTRYFSIAVFQYGLAAYDLLLLTNKQQYRQKFINCANWAIENQNDNGSWETFAPQNPREPYSSMAQGEGISLLVRAYKDTGNHNYLDSAQKALSYMLTDIQHGGVCEDDNSKLVFYEYTYRPAVLNGWIFSAWGLLDLYKITGDEAIRKSWEKTVKSLALALPSFDNGFWSKYDCGATLASPFYHRLHIAEMNVMYNLTDNEIFKQYAERWQKQLKNPINRLSAFCIKAYQKIIE